MIATICITTALIIISLFTVGHLINLTLEAVLIRLISIQEILKDTETSMVSRRVRDDLNHCNPVPCSEEACVEIKEEIIQDCLHKETEQIKPRRRKNKEYERKIADGFFEDLVIKILKEKREKMCSTVDILKRHRTTMNTFKRHATKEQIAELMALQVETKKQSVDKQRQNIYHKRS